MRYWFLSLIFLLAFSGVFAFFQEIKAQVDPVVIESALIDGGSTKFLFRGQTHELTITTDKDFFLGDVENLSISLENAEVLTRTWINRTQIKITVKMNEAFSGVAGDSTAQVELLVEDISASLPLSRLFIDLVTPKTAVPGETVSMTIKGEGFSHIVNPATSVRFFAVGKNDPVLSNISVQDDKTIVLTLQVPATQEVLWDISVTAAVSATNSEKITVIKINALQTLPVGTAPLRINAVQYRPTRVNTGEQIFVQMQGVGFTDFGFASIENEKIKIEFSPAIPGAVIRPVLISEGELNFYIDIPEDAKGGMREIFITRESRNGEIAIAPNTYDPAWQNWEPIEEQPEEHPALGRFDIWGKMVVYAADVFFPPPGPPDETFSEEFFTVAIVGDQLFDSFFPQGKPELDFGLEKQNIEYVKRTRTAIVANLKIAGTQQGTVKGFTVTRELQDGTVETVEISGIEFFVGQSMESSAIINDSATLEAVKDSGDAGDKSPRFEFTLPREQGEVFQNPKELFETLQGIVKWIFAFVVAISLIFLILAVFQFVTGGGDPQQVSEARQKLLYAVIGLAIGFVVLGIPAIIRNIVV